MDVPRALDVGRLAAAREDEVRGRGFGGGGMRGSTCRPRRPQPPSPTSTHRFVPSSPVSNPAPALACPGARPPCAAARAAARPATRAAAGGRCGPTRSWQCVAVAWRVRQLDRPTERCGGERLAACRCHLWCQPLPVTLPPPPPTIASPPTPGTPNAWPWWMTPWAGGCPRRRPARHAATGQWPGACLVAAPWRSTHRIGDPLSWRVIQLIAWKQFWMLLLLSGAPLAARPPPRARAAANLRPACRL